MAVMRVCADGRGQKAGGQVAEGQVEASGGPVLVSTGSVVVGPTTSNHQL